MIYILSFLSYLKKPCVPQKLIHEKKLAPLLWLFLFFLLTNILLDMLVSNNKYLQAFLQSDGGKNFENVIYKDGFLFSFVTVVILTPIAEELLARYYLISFKANYALLPINLSIIAVELFPTTTTLQFGFAIFACAFSWLFYKLTKNNSKCKMTLLNFYVKQYWIFYYCSAFAFGVLHLANYKIHSLIPVLPLLLVLPQLFGGLVLGYVRITKGLKWSMLFHAANNLVALIMLFCI